MAVSSDVTFSQDGAGNAKLHPYVVALVRWCVSCVWGAATVLLHRLMTAPLPPIAAPPARPPRPPPRPAGSSHLHPEPRVECVILHSPEQHEADFVFLHGLYGSLENTWRQGDWSSKYKLGPNRVSLRRPSSIPTPCICEECQNGNVVTNTTGEENIDDIFSTMFKEKARENKDFFQKVLSNEDDLITEKFYNGSMDKVTIVDNYEMQAQFVRSLFENDEDDNNVCEDKANTHNDTPGTPKTNYECECRDCVNGNGVYDDICEEKAKTHSDTPDTPKSNYKCECRECENGNGAYNHICEEKAKTHSDTPDTPKSNYKCECRECENGNGAYNHICEEKAKTHSDTPDTPKSNYKCECRECGNGNGVYSNICDDKAKTHSDTPDTPKSNHKCECRECDNGNGVKCVPGCGCICEDCYSPCWPRDWLKVDFPNARIISVNYTSDPHLWRPLWVKGCKRLRLQERAGQMSEQLLSLGVGRVPIVWVAHSKGGLFAKQIYCEAYEAYLKTREETSEAALPDDINIEMTLNAEINTECNKYLDNENIIDTDNIENNAYRDVYNMHEQDHNGNKTSHRDKNCHFYEEVVCNSDSETGQIIDNNVNYVKTDRENEQGIVNEKDDSIIEKDIGSKDIDDYTKDKISTSDLNNKDKDSVDMVTENTSDLKNKINTIDINNEDDDSADMVTENTRDLKNKINTSDMSNEDKDSADLVTDDSSDLKNEDSSDIINNNENSSDFKGRQCSLEERASLWSNSVGFMFYSVPHRGSALADFKTPITARSIELLEISKDNSQILSLQQRWLRATEPTRPQVRSLVETNRTLMAVLWLRIVSVESADAGVGALCGVSVDHREICKPSSRRCVLYTELSNLIHAATNRWRCRAEV